MQTLPLTLEMDQCSAWTERTTLTTIFHIFLRWFSAMVSALVPCVEGTRWLARACWQGLRVRGGDCPHS